jgi:hypothetical protein
MFIISTPVSHTVVQKNGKFEAFVLEFAHLGKKYFVPTAARFEDICCFEGENTNYKFKMIVKRAVIIYFNL